MKHSLYKNRRDSLAKRKIPVDTLDEIHSCNFFLEGPSSDFRIINFLFLNIGRTMISKRDGFFELEEFLSFWSLLLPRIEGEYGKAPYPGSWCSL